MKFLTLEILQCTLNKPKQTSKYITLSIDGSDLRSFRTVMSCFRDIPDFRIPHLTPMLEFQDALFFIRLGKTTKTSWP